MFYVDTGHFLFFDSFFVYFVYNFWDSRYRKKKKASHKDLCSKVGGLLCLFVLI